MQMTDLCLTVVQFNHLPEQHLISIQEGHHDTFTDGVTTCHTISAVFEEKIHCIRDDINEKCVRMRQNNSEVNCFLHI